MESLNRSDSKGSWEGRRLTELEISDDVPVLRLIFEEGEVLAARADPKPWKAMNNGMIRISYAFRALATALWDRMAPRA